MPDYERGLRNAVRYFWTTREQQSTRQGMGEDRDRGGRGAVTGGKQMDGFVRLVRDLLITAKVPQTCIAIDKRIELPGWFRAEKKWDLVIVHEGELLAAVEFKSQIGPSFGNNFNNRTEEALGSATDLWAAYREGAFRPSARPFLGYLMLLEDSSRSRSPIKVCAPHFPVFPEFNGASYQQRYAILIEKLVRERLYDGACFLTSDADGGANGDYLEPHPELTFAKFVAPPLGPSRVYLPVRACQKETEGFCPFSTATGVAGNLLEGRARRARDTPIPIAPVSCSNAPASRRRARRPRRSGRCFAGAAARRANAGQPPPCPLPPSPANSRRRRC